MGATSVTGKGPGASYSGMKGPGNNRSFFVPQITPHVIVAGEVALVGGAATVTFPTPLAGTQANYVVMLTTNGATNLCTVGTKTNNGDGNFVSFTIAGNTTNSIMYAVMNKGVA